MKDDDIYKAMLTVLNETLANSIISGDWASCENTLSQMTIMLQNRDEYLEVDGSHAA